MHVGPIHAPARPESRPTPRRLNICHVMATFPTLAETFIANEIRALRALGHVVVPVVVEAAVVEAAAVEAAAVEPGDVAMQPEDLPLRQEAIRLTEVETLSALTAAAAHPAGLAAAMGFAQRQDALPRRTLLRAAARLAYIAHARQCTHIHAHFARSAAAIAICAARIAGITASFAGHASDLSVPETDLVLTLAAADLAVAGSENVAAAFRRLAPHARVRTIPIGVAAERFQPFAGPSNGRLLAVGRLLPCKGFSNLLDALARMDAPPPLDLVGGGPLADELARRARDLGLGETVRFLGPRTAAWIAAEGPRYQGLVAPGVIAPDGARDIGPLVVREAMAMGLPVVASALPDLSETVDASCARLVPPGDADALAGAVQWLAGLQSAERERLGAAGRARAQERFSLRLQATQLAGVFSTLHV